LMEHRKTATTLTDLVGASALGGLLCVAIERVSRLASCREHFHEWLLLLVSCVSTDRGCSWLSCGDRTTGKNEPPGNEGMAP
jgi:hypothetical protein